MSTKERREPTHVLRALQIVYELADEMKPTRERTIVECDIEPNLMGFPIFGNGVPLGGSSLIYSSERKLDNEISLLSSRKG